MSNFIWLLWNILQLILDYISIYVDVLIYITIKYIIMKCLKDTEIQSVSDILNIVSQPNRLHILCLLNKKWELCVCEIMDELKLKQNLISHHLWLLKNIWLLTTRREWKNIFYAINEATYKQFKWNLKNIFNI